MRTINPSLAFDAFLNSLTLDQALAWFDSDEKFMHVVDNYDKVLYTNGSVNHYKVELVEATFLNLLGK